MNGKELFEVFQDVEDKYLDIAEAPVKENILMKQQKPHGIGRKSIDFLIAAAITVSLLTVTASAAGWLPGIFQAMKEEAPQNEALFEAAAQANAEAKPEMVDIPQLDYSKFTLFERYYDGETILLGYDMSLLLPEPVVGYEPDQATMEKIQEEIQLYQSDGALQDFLSEEAYQKALAIMQEAGSVCIVTHNVYVGDHIYVNGADIGEVLSEEVWSMREDYEVEQGSCILLNPLPEAGRNQDQVEVTLKIKSSQMYWYFDAEGNSLLFKTDNHQEEVASFILENVNKK